MFEEDKSPYEAPTRVGTHPDRGDLSEEQSSLKTVPPSVSAKPSQESVEAFLPNWDRYRLIAFLGQGGMGKVFLAHDPRLNRPVALKFLLTEDPEFARRFLLEAQSQAQVEHENVCKIYEVGEVAGKLYIAMQYIAGKTLKEVSGELSLNEKIRLIKEVCEGIHAAHRTGLVHRDIKPSNIMVEKKEGSMWKPYVMDFGLARGMHDTGKTVSGTILGTPAYMSPEQATGEIHRIDRRSDIYSIGATFYELLCGRPPFESLNTIEILQRVVQEDPIPPRRYDRNIPSEVETILMKCMEKDQNRRFDSALAVAEDLQRYLDGEPILARPSSLLYRVAKKIRKNKAIFAATTLAIVLFISFLFYIAFSRWQSRKQQFYIRQISQQTAEMETIMRYAHMQPAHDIRREKIIVRKRMQAIQQQIEQKKDTTSGPGHYALGRGYLALEEFTKARQHLERAWQSGYTEPEVAYSLGRVLGNLYAEAFRKIQSNPNLSLRKKQLTALERTLRNPALEYLRRGWAVEKESPAYVQALIAFYERKWDLALAKADTALKEIPWLYEAQRLKGEVYLAHGSERRINGYHREAIRLFQQAEQSFQKTIEMARSDAASYSGLCGMFDEIIEIHATLKTSPEQAFEMAVKTCEDAIEIDPEQALPYLKLSDAYWRRAEFQISQGRDPSEDLSRALEIASRSLKINPEPYAYDNIGLVFLIRATEEIEHGKNPLKNADLAIKNFQSAIHLDKNFKSSYNNMGEAFAIKGQYLLDHGMDPRESIIRARTLYEEFLKREHSYIPLTNTASVLLMQAKYEALIGMDPSESLEQAASYALRAIQKNPNSLASHLTASEIYEQKTLSGTDNGSRNDSLKQAQYHLQNAFKNNADSPMVFKQQGRLFLLEAQLKQLPQLLTQAEASFTKALSISPRDVESQKGLVQTLFEIAKWKKRQGQKSTNELIRAQNICAAVLKQNPDLAEILALQGLIFLEQGQPRPAIQAMERALQINRNLLRIYEPELKRAAAASR